MRINDWIYQSDMTSQIWKNLCVVIQFVCIWTNRFTCASIGRSSTWMTRHIICRMFLVHYLGISRECSRCHLQGFSRWYIRMFRQISPNVPEIIILALNFFWFPSHFYFCLSFIRIKKSNKNQFLIPEKRVE